MKSYYEVTASSGTSHIIYADNAREAKQNVQKRQYYPSTYRMTATRIDISNLEVLYRPLNDEEVLEQYIGKDVVIYDEHHGTAIRIKRATLAAIQHFIDGYSTIIIL